jgi:cystathionine beta-lyase/cystathionine gamma-synthase
MRDKPDQAVPYAKASGPNTMAAHAGQAGNSRSMHSPAAGAPPIYQSSVFTFDSLEQVDDVFAGRTQGYSYSRVGNPNVDQLAAAVAQIEDAPAGMAAASGMAAITAGLRACLGPQRRRIVAADDIYGGTYSLFKEVLEPEGIEIVYVPSDRPDLAAGACTPNTAAFYFESVSNPTLRVPDLPALARVAQAAGVPLVVDNTFASPAMVKPFPLGASLVAHSATKFLAGHHDALAGVLVGQADLVARASHYNMLVGGTLDPFCAWLVLRGIRTFGVRMERQMANAASLATHLAALPMVCRVDYPGLATHPDHDVACRIGEGRFGAMLSFDLGDLDHAQTFVRSLRLIQFAPSLGGYDTTISHPVLTSHRAVPAKVRATMGIGDGLIRMSVGCEDLADIIFDLDQALACR